MALLLISMTQDTLIIGHFLCTTVTATSDFQNLVSAIIYYSRSYHECLFCVSAS